jgi:hypothetical protein
VLIPPMSVIVVCVFVCGGGFGGGPYGRADGRRAGWWVGGQSWDQLLATVEISPWSPAIPDRSSLNVRSTRFCTAELWQGISTCLRGRKSVIFGVWAARGPWRPSRKVGGFAPRVSEGFSGPPGPPRPQKWPIPILMFLKNFWTKPKCSHLWATGWRCPMRDGLGDESVAPRSLQPPTQHFKVTSPHCGSCLGAQPLLMAMRSKSCSDVSRSGVLVRSRRPRSRQEQRHPNG